MMAVDHEVSKADYALLENRSQEEKTESCQTPKKCFLVGGIELVADENQDGIDDDDELMILTPLSSKGCGNKQDPIDVEEYEESRGGAAAVVVATSYLNDCAIYEAATGVKIKIEKPCEPFFFPSSSANKNRSKPSLFSSVREKGESSNSREVVSVEEVERIGAWKQFVCEICAESKLKIDSFSIKLCTHSYCLECINSLIVTKLDAGVCKISCPVPDCFGVLEPDYCRDIIPADVFNRWGDALCESVIEASQKFYCPFKDCSALFVMEGDDELITSSECHACHRLFCAQCKDVWHAGIECSEYQLLDKSERGKEDIMLRQLASSKQWQRCPSCKFYVDRIDGCLFMKCRCGIAFCYHCGDIIKNEGNHYCTKCGR